MTSKLSSAALVFVATLVLGVTAAFAAQSAASADPGVTATSVLLGGTTPLSGSASASHSQYSPSLST